jgi:hypothetical protein
MADCSLCWALQRFLAIRTQRRGLNGRASGPVGIGCESWRRDLRGDTSWL